jgi:hypothetical protein
MQRAVVLDPCVPLDSSHGHVIAALHEFYSLSRRRCWTWSNGGGGDRSLVTDPGLYEELVQTVCSLDAFNVAKPLAVANDRLD